MCLRGLSDFDGMVFVVSRTPPLCFFVRSMDAGSHSQRFRLNAHGRTTGCNVVRFPLALEVSLGHFFGSQLADRIL